MEATKEKKETTKKRTEYDPNEFIMMRGFKYTVIDEHEWIISSLLKYAKHYGLKRMHLTSTVDKKRLVVAIIYRKDERTHVPPAFQRYMRFNNLYEQKKYIVLDLHSYDFDSFSQEMSTFFLNREQAEYFNDTKIIFSGIEIKNGFYHYKFNNALMPYDRLYELLHTNEVVLPEVLKKAHEYNSVLLKCKLQQLSDIDISEEKHGQVLAKMEILLHSNIYLKAYFVNNDSIKEHFPYKGTISY